ncbi:hypothetical protein CONCODRAFT_3294 [Conidiobolus coronatus NRRL 28638]|uniref:G-protein coupled receptors family 1 profile domain-containing protein n=1 Tax=Conidiobolus coronatus (strain ATCC 28846 / CBS 209.66 / NRRL 28638) TaxID=796925 RepID=A0A137PFF8_CONC2|nr:hypothetical protein CONCODRAFT_3294 [Conidiobolus coronatus NRRL 28638]|eukprot:KXN73734.1 hypothetical protein CONCODRAFT_3294 [Conidiobolus coronatus NRRL 28638]
MTPAAKYAYALHPYGIGASVIVLVSIIILTLINKKFTDKMAIRLIFSISLANLVSHLSEYFSVLNGGLALGSTKCATVNGLRLFSRTFYAFTYISASLHLFRSFAQSKKSNLKSEITIWTGTVILSGVFTAIYWALGAFSGKLNKVGCNPGADNFTTNLIFYLTVGSVDLLAIISGIYTFYARSKFNRRVTQISFNVDPSETVVGSFYYPLTTAITLPFEAGFLFFQAFGIFAWALTIPMAVTMALSGVFTAILFVSDTSVQEAFVTAYFYFTGQRIINQAVNNISASTPLLQ